MSLSDPGHCKRKGTGQRRVESCQEFPKTISPASLENEYWTNNLKTDSEVKCQRDCQTLYCLKLLQPYTGWASLTQNSGIHSLKFKTKRQHDTRSGKFYTWHHVETWFHTEILITVHQIAFGYMDKIFTKHNENLHLDLSQKKTHYICKNIL